MDNADSPGAGSALPGAAEATILTAGLGGQVPGVTTVIDASHASPEVVRSLAAYFQDKASRDVDNTVAHFSTEPFVYIDAGREQRHRVLHE